MSLAAVKPIEKPAFCSLVGSFVYDAGVYEDAAAAYRVSALYRVDGLLNKPDQASMVDDTLSVALATLEAVGMNNYSAVYLVGGYEFGNKLFYQINRFSAIDAETLKEAQAKHS